MPSRFLTFPLVALVLAGCAKPVPPPELVPPTPPLTQPPGAPPVATIPAGPVVEDAKDGVVGARGTPYAILEFSDLQCPFCGPAFGVMDSYVHQHADVRLVVKHYPISGLCNPDIEGARHEFACAAAAAVICANEQGKFDALAGLLYSHQDMLADMSGFEKQAGVAGKRFDACLAGPEPAAVLAQDLKEAEAVKVEGTPTIFVYGPWGPRWIQIHGGAAAATAAIDAARAHQPLPSVAGETGG